MTTYFIDAMVHLIGDIKFGVIVYCCRLNHLFPNPFVRRYFGELPGQNLSIRVPSKPNHVEFMF